MAVAYRSLPFRVHPGSARASGTKTNREVPAENVAGWGRGRGRMGAIPPGGGRTPLPASCQPKQGRGFIPRGRAATITPHLEGGRPGCSISSTSSDHNTLLLKFSASVLLLRNRDAMTIFLCSYLCLCLSFYFLRISL